MADLKTLEIQLATLQEQVNAERARVRTETLQAIGAMLESGTLTPADLYALMPEPATPKRDRTIKNPPMYRDPVSGNTWSGKGKNPEWIIGKNRDDFLIRDAA